jgi:hypothetical protein
LANSVWPPLKKIQWTYTYAVQDYRLSLQVDTSDSRGEPMSRSFVRRGALIALISSAITGPASAANWVTTGGDDYQWIDAASCEVKDDGGTYCITAQSKQKGVNPDVAGTLMGNTPEVDIAVKGATDEVFFRTMTNFDEWEASNHTVPEQYVWQKNDYGYNAAVVRIVCHR